MYWTRAELSVSAVWIGSASQTMMTGAGTLIDETFVTVACGCFVDEVLQQSPAVPFGPQV